MDEIGVELVKLIVALISGGGALKLLQAVQNYRRERAANRIPAVLDRVQDVYAHLHVLRQQTQAVRVVLLAATNGGGIPKPGTPLYSSVRYESTGDVPPVSDRWDKRRVDEPYLAMLRQVASEGSTRLRVSNMQDGELKDLFEGDGIWGSDVVEIKRTELAFYYLSLNYAHEPSNESAAYRRSAISATVGKLARLLNDVEPGAHPG